MPIAPCLIAAARGRLRCSLLGARRAAGQRQLPGLAGRGQGRVLGHGGHDRGDHPARPLQPEPRRPAARRRRAETTVCKGTPFGKTVWYDLAPQFDGGRRGVGRRTGFKPVVAVYEWNRADSQITRLVDCTPNAGGEDLLLDVKAASNYTIQVGGVGGAGGR